MAQSYRVCLRDNFDQFSNPVFRLEVLRYKLVIDMKTDTLVIILKFAIAYNPDYS